MNVSTPMTPPASNTDVLIVGAGPTGLTLAVALAIRGLQANCFAIRDGDRVLVPIAWVRSSRPWPARFRRSTPMAHIAARWRSRWRPLPTA